MSKPKFKLPKPLIRLLNESGLPWCVEPGTKHGRLLVCGRLVAPISYGRGHSYTNDERRLKNSLAAVRRILTEMKSA